MDFTVSDLKPVFTLDEAARLWCEVAPLGSGPGDVKAQVIFNTMVRAAEAGALRVDRTEATGAPRRWLVSRERLTAWAARVCAEHNMAKPQFLFRDARAAQSAGELDLLEAACALCGVGEADRGKYTGGTIPPGGRQQWDEIEAVYDALRADIACGKLPARKSEDMQAIAVDLLFPEANAPDMSRVLVAIEDLAKWSISRSPWMVLIDEALPAPPVAPAVAVAQRATLIRKAMAKIFDRRTEAQWNLIFASEKTNGFKSARAPREGRITLYFRDSVEAWLVQQGIYLAHELENLRRGEQSVKERADLASQWSTSKIHRMKR